MRRDELDDLEIATDCTEVERAERLAADAQIVEALRRIDFDASSPEWRELSSALIEYGCAVLSAWAASRVLYGQAVSKGVRGLGRLSEVRLACLDADQARALATDVVIVAIGAFRTKSLPVWTPTGGASLTTFFIGRCLMELPDVLQEWQRREVGDVADEPFSDEDDDRQTGWPTDVVTARVRLDELLKGDLVLRAAFEMQEMGYALMEIVTILRQVEPSVTSASLRTKMHRLRRRAVYGERATDG